jgi:hypothetical protein
VLGAAGPEVGGHVLAGVTPPAGASDPDLTTGLLLVAAGAIIIAAAIGGSRSPARYAGIPLAAGFALYLPQFTAGQPVRVAHGLLITAGGLLLARNLARRTGPDRA